MPILTYAPAARARSCDLKFTDRVIAAWNGEFRTVWRHVHNVDANFQLVFALNMIFGSMLNYSMFLCTTTNSPLTTTVIGPEPASRLHGVSSFLS